jgi:archaellum biogenesis protein FlaJ (TadC family)
MQRRQEKNSDRLELLKKARQLGNKYSEKIAKEVRSRSRKVEQKEFETLLGRTSNISSPEKHLQAELFA